MEKVKPCTAQYDRAVYSSFRTRDILTRGFDEIQILLRYLYMNEDHAIVFDNGLCKLEIKMTPSMDLTARNLNFPDFPATHRAIELPELLGIIEQLEETPAVEYPDSFANRWEEVKTICASTMVQTQIKK